MIKKTLALACLSFALAAPAFCQTSEATSPTDSTNTKSFKPHAGNATTEIGLNLADWNSSVFNQIRFRIFTSSKTALRLGLNGNIDKVKSEASTDDERSYKSITISPGIEKHFAGTDRISPYFGVEFSWRKLSSKDEGAFYSIQNGWQGDINRAYNSFGINALLGTDFYVAKNFYIGIEVGLGYAHYNYKDIISTQFSSQPSSPVTSKGYTSNTFGTIVKNSLRIGYAF